MTHRRAVLLMLLVTLMWSSAGVVTRQLEAARGFEVTFWRSGFNALALAFILGWLRGGGLWVSLRSPAVWASGLCWAVMFTAFMVALTLTQVANVLVTMALGPLLTALLAWVFLRQAIPWRTWMAIVLAGAGIAWMFGAHAQAGDSQAGVWVALAVPVASATNWCVLQAQRDRGAARDDMLPAVLLGALLSALAVLPLAWPLRVSPHDLVLLAGLGLFQLAIPCLLAVRLARELPGHELALLGLTETLLGVLWAWLFAGEAPSSATLIGGGLVIVALVFNEILSTPSAVFEAKKNA